MRTLAITLTLGLAAAAAGAQTWTPAGGPPGGDVRALAADPRDPRVLYLGTSEGHLYRSEDAGQSWSRTRPGFPLRGMSLDDIAVAPGGEILVGYWEVAGSGGGVARSEDGGRSFRLLPGIEGESVRAVALAPSQPGTVLAGSLTGVFRSDDAGASWRRISPKGHAGIVNVESLAVEPTDPETVYAGTWHLAWKTSDGGRGWRAVHAGMIPDSDVFTLTLDRRSPRTVYATACSGIYRSRDAGGLWAKLRGIPASSRRTRAFSQDPEQPDRLYAGTTEGLFVSQDGGGSWSLATRSDVVVNAILPLPGGTLLLGVDGAGVLRSQDRGRSFRSANQGFSERFVARLLFDRPRGRLLAAIAGDRAHGGVLQAPEPSGPWAAVGEGLAGREVAAIAVAGAEVLAGTDDGVFLSVSGSGLWRRLPTLVDGSEAHPRVADVAAPSQRILLAATDQGLLRSADGGRTWRRQTLGLARAVSAVAVAPDRPDLVLAATPLGVYRSADAGATWAAASLAFALAPVRMLTFQPGDGGVFATTAKGLYKSLDRGETWGRRGGGLPQSDIAGLAVHPDGRTVFASDFTLGGLYRSDDGGDTWRAFSTEGLTTERVWALAVDPSASLRLLAATPSGGLHVLGGSGGAADAGAR